MFEALAGDDDKSAIADKVWNEETESWDITGNRFDPDLSAELYITNGDALDDAYRTKKILGFTPEGSTPNIANVSDFEFQDVEADIEAEFQRHRLFALDLAESADDPGNPVSHMGNTVRDFYVDEFADSYGDPQAVQVTAKRSLGTVQVRYRINEGPVKTGQHARVRRRRALLPGARRLLPPDARHGRAAPSRATRSRCGSPAGASPPRTSPTPRGASRTPTCWSSSDENYTGGVPAQDPDGPHYLTYYTDALDALDVDYEIYDVDARGNRSPDALGVLSHFDAVIWYTGDDYLTRLPNQVPGTGTARLAVEEMIDVRDHLNEGGKLFFTGKNAGLQYAEGNEFRNFGFPEPEGAPGDVLDANVYDPQFCNKNGADADPSTPAFDTWPEFDADDPTVSDGCIAHNDDFLQYYLGAYVYASPGNTFDDAEGHPYPLTGTDGGPFEDLTWSFDETGANNQDHSATFVVTSSILDPDRYPLYADSQSVADWLRPGAAPFSPYSGEQYMAAGAHSGAYKRFGKVVDLTGATAPRLDFQFSADLEDQWDFFVVEARDVTTDPDSDAWTTLPEADTDGAGPDTSLTALAEDEAPGATAARRASRSAATRCTRSSATTWATRRTASPTGTTGEWHAFTGSSGGWDELDGRPVGVRRQAGRAAALGHHRLGHAGARHVGRRLVADGRRDDARVQRLRAAAGRLLARRSAARGHGEPGERLDAERPEFTEGGVVATDDTVYTGFGFEGINEAARTEFLRRTLTHLGVEGLPGAPAAPVAPTRRGRDPGGGDHRDQGQGPRVREAQGRQAAPRRSQGAREGARRGRGR